MARKIQAGTPLKVQRTSGRLQHGIVKTVTNQNSVTVSVGKGTAFTATRGASTTTRGFIFTESA